MSNKPSLSSLWNLLRFSNYQIALWIGLLVSYNQLAFIDPTPLFVIWIYTHCFLVSCLETFEWIQIIGDLLMVENPKSKPGIGDLNCYPILDNEFSTKCMYHFLPFSYTPILVGCLVTLPWFCELNYEHHNFVNIPLSSTFFLFILNIFLHFVRDW